MRREGEGVGRVHGGMAKRMDVGGPSWLEVVWREWMAWCRAPHRESGGKMTVLCKLHHFRRARKLCPPLNLGGS